MASLNDGSTSGGSPIITVKNLKEYLDQIGGGGGGGESGGNSNSLQVNELTFEEYTLSKGITSLQQLTGDDIGLYATSGVENGSSELYGTIDIPEVLTSSYWNAQYIKLDTNGVITNKSPLLGKCLLFIFNKEPLGVAEQLILLAYHYDSQQWYKMESKGGLFSGKWQVSIDMTREFKSFSTTAQTMKDLDERKLDKSKNLSDLTDVMDARGNLNIHLIQVLGENQNLFASQKLVNDVNAKVLKNVGDIVLVNNRVDATDTKVTDLILNKADKTYTETEINSLKETKADKTYVETGLDSKITGGSVVQVGGNSTVDVPSIKLFTDKIDDIEKNYLKAGNNLGDVLDISTARINLGLKSASTKDSTTSEGTSDDLVATQSLVDKIKKDLVQDINTKITGGEVKQVMGDSEVDVPSQKLLKEMYDELFFLLTHVKGVIKEGHIAVRYVDGTEGHIPYVNATGTNDITITNVVDILNWGDFKKDKPTRVSFESSKSLISVPTYLPDSITNMSGMFDGASNFNSDISSWNLSNVTWMYDVFRGASSFNQDLSKWDVSNVTNMSGMFKDATSFNGDISTWDVSKVTDMSGMFQGATSFNGDISTWDVNARYMGHMFREASSFNQDLSKWDVSKVTSMPGMFDRATSFNGDISTWDVSKVTNMSNMFRGAVSFNIDITRWNVGKVTDMNGMFSKYNSNSHNTIFNQDISSWDVSNVTDMSSMFEGASDFNQNLSSYYYAWNTSKVTNMSSMFEDATSFNGILNHWDVSNVTNMRRMFANASAYTEDLYDWDVSNVTDMTGMFKDATTFNGNISTWDVSNALFIYSMFEGASNFNRDISKWNFSGVTSMERVFYGATSFNGDISTWDVSKVTNMSGMFQGATSFNGDISTWDVSKVTNMSGMFQGATSFNGDISTWDVSNVTSMGYMFSGTTSLDYTQDLSKWNVSKVGTMRNMFEGSSFNGDISNWDTSSVQIFYLTFKNAVYFNSDISKWDVGRATNMTEMFDGATMFNRDLSNWCVYRITEKPDNFDNNTPNWTLPKPVWGTCSGRMVIRRVGSTEIERINIPLVGSNLLQDVEEVLDWGYTDESSTANFNLKSVIKVPNESPIWLRDFSRMFMSNKIFNQDISNWNVSHVNDMSLMFYGTSFNHPLDSWDVSNVNNMNSMFNSSEFNQPLDSWDVSNVNSMAGMFFSARSFNQPLDSWDVSNVSISLNMFRNALNFNQPLDSWVVRNITDMSGMFMDATSFNQDLSLWCVSNITSKPTSFDKNTPEWSLPKPVWGTCPPK